MASDAFELTGQSLIAPASQAFAITPSDTDDLPRAAKAFYVGTGGDVVVRAIDSNADVVLRNAAAGSVIAIRLRAVRSAGTTAGDLIGLA
jgi:hypothetical protein